MPRAEYVPYTTVKPEGPRAVAERVDINYPHVELKNSVSQAVAQTGEGMQTLSRSVREVGGAFDNLGRTFEHVGDQLWQRAQGLQEVQNQTVLTKAEIEYDKYANDKQVAFNQLQGDAASEGAYKAHLTDLEDKRKQMLEKLPNQSVQNRFDKSTASTVGRYGMQAAAHAATETRKSFIASSEARVDQTKDQLSKTTDIKETEELAKRIHDEIFGKQAPAKGWTLEVANEAFKKQLGDAYASQAVRMSREDPTGARKLLEANQDFIGKDRYDAAMEHVLSNERNIQSNNIGNKVQEDNPDGTLPEKKAEAKKQAEAISKDPKLIQAAIDSAEQKHEKHRREVAQQKQVDKETVYSTLYGYNSPHGEVPTTPYELFAYGGEEARRAYERLDPAERRKVDEFLKRSAKGEVPETEFTRNRVRDLEGMMLNEPGRFRDHDIDREEIPLSERSRLRREQVKMIKEGIKLEADPKTAHAINVMRSAGGVLPKDLKPGSSKWNTFTGMVREGLIEIGKQRGYDKPISEEEIRTLGKSILEKMPGTGFWPEKLDWFQKSVYDQIQEIPPRVKTEMLKDFPEMTDAQLLEKYQRTKIIKEFNKRYNKPAAAP
jgi:hypothetical protein